MGILCVVLGLAMWAVGGLTILTGATSIQQIFGGILGVGGSALFGAGAICNAVDKLREVVTAKAGEKKPDPFAGA